MVRSVSCIDVRSAPVVLVIDDSASIRRLLQITLRQDFTVLCASGVDEGLQILKERRPHFIFIDYEMPGKDGLTGIREIRALNRDIPIVLLTGSATRELLREAIHHGADECVPKPFDVSVLKNVILRHLDRVFAAQPHAPHHRSDQDASFNYT